MQDVIKSVVIILLTLLVVLGLRVQPWFEVDSLWQAILFSLLIGLGNVSLVVLYPMLSRVARGRPGKIWTALFAVGVGVNMLVIVTIYQLFSGLLIDNVWFVMIVSMTVAALSASVITGWPLVRTAHRDRFIRNRPHEDHSYTVDPSAESQTDSETTGKPNTSSPGTLG